MFCRTAMNFLMTFVVGQSFLSMMCTMKFGIFLFFAGMVCLMSAFVAIVLPETQGIPLVCSLPSNVLCLRTPLLVASHQKLHAASASWHQSLTIYPACRGGGSSITKACVRSAALLYAAVLQKDSPQIPQDRGICAERRYAALRVMSQPGFWIMAH